MTDISKTAVQILYGMQKHNSVNVSGHLFLRTVQETTGETSDQSVTEFDQIIRTVSDYLDQIPFKKNIKFPYIKVKK